MSENLDDYMSSLEEAQEEALREEEDPFISIEEAGVDRVVGAKDN